MSHEILIHILTHRVFALSFFTKTEYNQIYRWKRNFSTYLKWISSSIAETRKYKNFRIEKNSKVKFDETSCWKMSWIFIWEIWNSYAIEMFLKCIRLENHWIIQSEYTFLSLIYFDELKKLPFRRRQNISRINVITFCFFLLKYKFK